MELGVYIYIYIYIYILIIRKQFISLNYSSQNFNHLCNLQKKNNFYILWILRKKVVETTADPKNRCFNFSEIFCEHFSTVLHTLVSLLIRFSIAFFNFFLWWRKNIFSEQSLYGNVQFNKSIRKFKEHNYIFRKFLKYF